MKTKLVALFFLISLFACNDKPIPNRTIVETLPPTDLNEKQLSDLKNEVGVRGFEEFFKAKDIDIELREPKKYSYNGEIVFKKSTTPDQIFYAGSGPNLSILSYKIDFENLYFLIKSRWTGAEITSADEKFISTYYEATLNIKDEYTISENLSGLSIDSLKVSKVEKLGIKFGKGQVYAGKVNDDKVNLRAKPMIDAEVLAVVNSGTPISVNGVSDSVENINNRVDYWYQVESEDQSGWIFGAYIDFFRENS